MTRAKNRIHSVLHASLIPPYQGELFSVAGRTWLKTQPLVLDETLAIQRRLADLDCRASDLSGLDQALAPSEKLVGYLGLSPSGAPIR